MTLCAACESVDFGPLINACLQQCRDRQEADYSYDSGSTPLPSNFSPIEQHRDIFEVEKSSQDCSLCKVIFQAFKERKVADAEEARGLPIVFRAFSESCKIEVRYDTKEGLIPLCVLDTYMNEVDGVYLPV